MSDPIQDAIAAAQAAAANPQTPTTVAAAAPDGGNIVAFVPKSGPPTVLKTSDMMVGSFSVDAYIKVSEHGMTIDTSALIINPFEVKIDLSEVFNHFSVKYGNNPTTYEKTTDKVSSLSGKPWGTVLQTAAKVDGPKFKGDYRSADIPMTLLSEVKDIKGIEVKPVGTRLGKSLSTTEWKEWELFIKTMQKIGLNVDTDEVIVEIGSKARTGGTNTWGVLTFTLKGLASDLADAA